MCCRLTSVSYITAQLENFTCAAQLLNTDDPVVLISSNYHMGRAVRMAEEAGFRTILRLHAPSDPLQFGANVMWEMILDMNETLNGK